MAQTAFAFDLPSKPAAPLASEAAGDFSQGYEIGREHARHGVVPPAEHLLPGHPVRQGWALAQPGFAGRTRHADATVRMWLQLRLHAWQQGRAFDTLQITPHYLRQLMVARCPVTREAIVGRGEAHIVRLCPEAGYVAGNLAVLGHTAARAHAELCEASDEPIWQAALTRAAQARLAANGMAHGLGALAWQRLATLVALVTPLPAATLAQLPLAALPPNRVLLQNPLQGLQTLATLQLAQADWSQRIAKLVDALPNATLRRSFHLWLHRLLPRVWEGGRPTHDAMWRERLEDAWQDPKVQAGWLRLASELSAAQVDALLRHAERLGVPGARVQRHDDTLRMEGPVSAGAPARQAAVRRGVERAARLIPLH